MAGKSTEQHFLKGGLRTTESELALYQTQHLPRSLQQVSLNRLAEDSSLDYRILKARQQTEDAERLLAKDYQRAPFLSYTSDELATLYLPVQLQQLGLCTEQALSISRDKLSRFIALRRGSVAKNTFLAEMQALKSYVETALALKFRALPISVEALKAYLSAFESRQTAQSNYQKTVKPNTLKNRSSMLCHLLINAGLLAAEHKFELAMHTQTVNSRLLEDIPNPERAPAIATGISLEDLQILSDITLKSGDLLQLRDLAMICSAWDGLLRRSEFTQLSLSDLRKNPGFTTQSPEQLLGQGDQYEWYIARSKTDQQAKGQYAAISNSSYQLVKLWCEQAGIQQDTIFQPLTRARRLYPQARALSKAQVARIFHNAHLRVAQALGFDIQRNDFMHSEAFIARWRQSKLWSSHSARVGGAIEHLVRKKTMEEVMKRGRWANMEMVSRYTRLVSGAELGESFGVSLPESNLEWR